MSSKITRANGPSIGVLPQEFDQGRFFIKGEKGGDDLSAGNSSSESETSNEKTPDRPTKTDEIPKPVPMTESPSSLAPTATSSAPRTAGGRGRAHHR